MEAFLSDRRTVVCHPDKYEAVRKAADAIGLIDVQTSRFLPDPDSIFMFRAPDQVAHVPGFQRETSFKGDTP